MSLNQKNSVAGSCRRLSQDNLRLKTHMEVRCGKFGVRSQRERALNSFRKRIRNELSSSIVTFGGFMVVLGRVCVAASNFLESLATGGNSSVLPLQRSRLNDACFTISFTLTSPRVRNRSVAQSAHGALEVAAQITHKRERRESPNWHRYQPSVGGYQDDGRGCA